MGGFPARPNRDAFGPTLEDEAPVENPKREIGADTFNLSWWQVAGLGKVVPKAWLKCTVAGAAITTNSQGLAFDPEGALGVLTWVYVGVGSYTIEFASQYADEDGTLINLSLVAGSAHPMGTASEFGVVDLTSGYQAAVRFFDDTGAPVDPGEFVVYFH